MIGVSTRRAFVATALGGVLGMVAHIRRPGTGQGRGAAGLLQTARHSDVDSGLLRHLRTLWQGDESAQRLGQAYLATRPAQLDPEVIARSLAAKIPQRLHRRAAGGGVRLREVLDLVVRQDFADGQTTLIEGWMLSETEAQLSALAVLG